MFNAGGSNVVSFRRAKAPPLSLADSERRGVTSVASLNILAPDLPCDAEPLAFHAAQGFGETFIPINDGWGIDHPFSRPVCYALIGIAGFTIYAAGAFAWWLA